MPRGIYQHKKGYKRPSFSKKWIDNLSKSHIGKIGFWTDKKRPPLSEKTKNKIREKLKGKMPKFIPNNKGRKHSEEIRIKMRKISKGLICITPIAQTIRESFKYKQWRSDIFIRDKFTCQKCGQIGGELEVHHKKSFSKLLKDVKNYLPLLPLYEGAMAYIPLWNINNGITLCKECHNETKKEL